MQDNLSDYVGAFYVRPSALLDLSYRFRLGKGDLQVPPQRRAGVVRAGFLRFNLGYINLSQEPEAFDDDDSSSAPTRPGSNSREEITLGVRVKLTDQIAIGGQTRRDLSAKRDRRQPGRPDLYAPLPRSWRSASSSGFTPDARARRRDGVAVSDRASRILREFETGGSLFGSESRRDRLILACLASCVVRRLAVLALLPAAGPRRTGRWRRSAPQRIAAVVNDDVITTQDLIDRLNLAIATSGLPNDDADPAAAGAAGPARLRRREAAAAGSQAPRHRRRPTPRSTRRSIRSPSATRPPPPSSDHATSPQRGLSPRALREQLRAQIAWIKIVGREIRPRIVVTQDQIDLAIKRSAARPATTASCCSARSCCRSTTGPRRRAC